MAATARSVNFAADYKVRKYTTAAGDLQAVVIEDQSGNPVDWTTLFGSISVSLSQPQVTSATVTQVTAAAASGELLAANSSRKALSVYNSHASDTAYINIGAAATTAKIPIRAGEWWHMYDMGVVFTQVINCIRGGSNDITLVVVHG